MFDLVADVERYPQFVPLCQSLRVRKRAEAREGREVIVADMTVAYKFIRETFTSRVTLDREQARNPGRISRGAVPADEQSLEVSSGRTTTPATSSSSSLTNSAAARSAS